VPTKTPIPNPPHDPASFEQAINDLGLGATRISLKSIPDAVHWHIRKPGVSGTLEATWRFGENGPELWLEVRANRSAPWQKGVLDVLTQGADGITPKR